MNSSPRASIGGFRVMRRIDQYLGPPICVALAVARAIYARLRHERPRAPARPRKILVIKFWGLGSITLTTPALRALKRAFPDAELTFLTFEQNEAVCRAVGWIDRVHPYRAGGTRAFVESFFELVRFLRRERFDVVMDLEFFSNFTSIVTALSSATTTVGFHTPKVWRVSFYTHPVGFDQRHITENFLRAAAALGAPSAGPELDAPVVDGPAAAAGLSRALAERGVADDDELICINVNASSLDHKRRWPLANYRELIERLRRHYPQAQVVLIGAREDVSYVTELSRTLAPGPGVVDLSGAIGIEQLVLLLQRARLFIGNDSGPLHLAAAAGLPTVSFFGPETPVLYGPRGAAHTILYKGIPCSPCLNVFNSKDNSACRDNVCMKAISVDEAWSAVRERLGGASEIESARVAGGRS